MRSILRDAIYRKQRVQLYYTFYSIALAESAMERVPLHSWEMEFSIQNHVTINSQLNDQNSIRYYIILNTTHLAESSKNKKRMSKIYTVSLCVHKTRMITLIQVNEFQ